MFSLQFTEQFDFLYTPLALRVHTEWQRPLSGVYSIMMEKLAHAGEGGGFTPIPFRYSYHYVQSFSVHSSGVRGVHSHAPSIRSHRGTKVV
jgi:hypothetical protein